MKAALKATPTRGASIQEVPIPKPTSHQALIRVKATSICGTDVHIYNWDAWAAKRIKTPMIFGHEFSGEVVEIGSQVEHIQVGDHISAETHIPCQGCFQCRTGKMHLCKNGDIIGVTRDGCFAEYIAIPAICCIKNDRSLPWGIASIQEPLGNAVYCVSEAQVRGKTVAILGDGPVGLFAAAVSRIYGATTVIVSGLQEYRLGLIKKFGADHLINASKQNTREVVMDLTRGEGVDIVMEMSGSEAALHDGFAIVKRGGTFVAFGIPPKPVTIDLAEELIFKGLKLIAINGRRMFETWYEVANLLNSGRLDLSAVLTHRFPLEKIDEAMALLGSKDIQAGKIILEP